MAVAAGKFSDEEIDAFMATVDTNKDGALDLAELTAAFTSASPALHPSKDPKGSKAKAMARQFMLIADTNKDGKISAEELKNMAKLIKEHKPKSKSQ